MAGTQAAGKHIMITLRKGKKRSHKRSVMERKVSKQHVFEVAFPCKHSRRDSKACTARDSKARECLDEFEGVFFMQPLLNYPNTTTPVFICSLSPQKQLILTTQWQCSSWEMPRDSRLWLWNSAPQLRGINKHAAQGLLSDIKLVREISWVFYTGWGPESQIAGHETAEQEKKRTAVWTSQQTRISIGTHLRGLKN